MLQFSRTDQSGGCGRAKKLACSVLLSSLTQTWWENPLQKRIHIPFRHKAALAHWSGAPDAAGACVQDTQTHGAAPVLVRRSWSSCAGDPWGAWVWKAGAAAAQWTPQNTSGRVSWTAGKATANFRINWRGYGVKSLLIGQAGMFYVWYHWHRNLLRETLLLPHWFQLHLGILCTCMTNACLEVPRQSGKNMFNTRKWKSKFLFSEDKCVDRPPDLSTKKLVTSGKNPWQMFVGRNKGE